MSAQLLSYVQLSAIPWTAARQAPLSMEILQARILEQVAMPSSRESSQTRDWTQVSRIAGRFFTVWDTREAPYWMESLKNVPGKACHYWVHFEDEILCVGLKFKGENCTHRHTIVWVSVCTVPEFSSLWYMKSLTGAAVWARTSHGPIPACSPG